MASCNKNLAGRFRGSLGKEIVFREWDGKTIVSKSPKHKMRIRSAAEAATQERFRLASGYAKGVMTNPDQSLAEAYALALKPRQNVYSRALADCLSPPVVRSIDVHNYQGEAGDKIAIRAVDDFRVTKVIVEIYAADGALLESGEAVQELNCLDWGYTATTANNTLMGTTIKAVAFDIPNNTGMLVETI